jgi:hypothetical protein
MGVGALVRSSISFPDAYGVMLSLEKLISLIFQFQFCERSHDLKSLQ